MYLKMLVHVEVPLMNLSQKIRQDSVVTSFAMLVILPNLLLWEMRPSKEVWVFRSMFRIKI